MDVNGEVKSFCENSKKKIEGGGLGRGWGGVARFGLGGGCGVWGM